MADTYSSHTTYNYAFNDPVFFNDPNGADPNSDGWNQIQESRNYDMERNYYNTHGTYGDDDMYGMMFGKIGAGVGNWYKVTNYWMEESGYKDDKGNFIQNYTYDYSYGYDTEMMYVYENQQRRQRQLNNAGPQPPDGWINVDKFLTLDFRNGLPPHDVGAFISLSYISNTNRFSGYNLIYNVSLSTGSVIETYPHDVVNQGPFYYGDDRKYGMDLFGKNNTYSPTEYPTMNFMGEVTVYGREGSNYTEIGTVRYGFTFNNGILAPINPTITYRGQ